MFRRFFGCICGAAAKKIAPRRSAGSATPISSAPAATGGRFATAAALADAIASTWGHGFERRFVVFTGGEPLLQLDAELVDAVRARGFFTAVEINGTLVAPAALDWICVSPKANTKLRQTAGQELKLVFPQPGALPEQFEGLDFQQPMDGHERARTTEPRRARKKYSTLQSGSARSVGFDATETYASGRLGDIGAAARTLIFRMA